VNPPQTSAVIPAHAGIQYSRASMVTNHRRSGILGRPVKPGDDGGNVAVTSE
jgi:hypothetical protein